VCELAGKSEMPSLVHPARAEAELVMSASVALSMPSLEGHHAGLCAQRSVAHKYPRTRFDVSIRPEQIRHAIFHPDGAAKL
jgi:hypothetical protein